MTHGLLALLLFVPVACGSNVSDTGVRGPMPGSAERHRAKNPAPGNVRAEDFIVGLHAAARGPLWTAVGSMGTSRSDHSATLLPSGKVLVVGGNDNDAALSSAELYDPATATWNPTGSLATARAHHSATLLPSGRVLVAGGSDKDQRVPLNSAELYDPATGTWSLTGSLGTPRGGHTATLLRSGKVFVAGGHDENTVLSSVELYDPSTGAWSPTGSLATPRAYHTATLLPSGWVVVAGGNGTGGLGPVSSADLYDPETEAWIVTAPLATARAYQSATLLPSGNVLVAGGESVDYDFLGPFLPDSAELYDLATGWRLTGFLATARAYQSATLLPSGNVLVAGGASLDSSNVPSVPLDSAEVYDPGTGTWSDTGSLGTARDSHTATLLLSGRVLVAGGNGAGGPLASAELLDPAFIVAIAPSSASVAPKATQTFAASGGSGPPYTWAFVTNESGGTLSTNGVYTAGARGGTRDVFTVTDSLGDSTTARVGVTGGVVVSPSSVTLAPETIQSFTASGGSGTGYTWAFTSNASGGALSAAGVYTAGAKGSVSDLVGVTDSLGNSATATVTVTASPTASPMPRPAGPPFTSGCGATGGNAFPLLALALLPLLTLRRRPPSALVRA